jgi:hypothetical protein
MAEAELIDNPEGGVDDRAYDCAAGDGSVSAAEAIKDRDGAWHRGCWAKTEAARRAADIERQITDELGAGDVIE